MFKPPRPSPTQSAAATPIGTIMTGNDGYQWRVFSSSTGTHRWVRHHQQLQQKIPMFHPKDGVIFVDSGWGANREMIGRHAIIKDVKKLGDDYWYTIYNAELYTYKDGSTTESGVSPWIKEPTFQLLSEDSDLDIENIIKKQKAKKMSTQATAPQTGKVRMLNKRTTQEVRTIETSLINKEEVFKMLALAEATGLPCLLVGNPGVAKTKTIIEYAKAWLNKDGSMKAEDFVNKIYILETDEGTKSSEIKGMPDLGELFTHNKYALNTPIADAEIVIINEVDKASSAIRNAMLGVMNEKFLFNGKHKIPCKWKLFVATCNEIPKEEVGSPFWDRFMLKMTVNRVSAGELVKYFDKGARNYRERFSIGVPSKTEIENVSIPTNKLEKYLDVAYQHSSDRTLTFVPGLAKAVSFIWDISMDKALVKTAQIMISQAAGSELQNKLMSTEVKAVMSKVEMLPSYTTNEQLELAIAEIEAGINTYASRGIMDQSQVEEIETSIAYILETHPARKDYQSNDGFNDMMEELGTTDAKAAF